MWNRQSMEKKKKYTNVWLEKHTNPYTVQRDFWQEIYDESESSIKQKHIEKQKK